MDKKKLAAWMKAEGMEIPKKDDAFWKKVHTERANCMDLPRYARAESQAWLRAKE